MPIYEYICSACEHRTDILHGINDPGPAFCPNCGAEGTMRKAFAPPAIHFKGGGWAKKERRSSAPSSIDKTKTASDTSDGSATSDKPAKAETTSTKSSDGDE